jgi:hypothetical protein
LDAHVDAKRAGIELGVQTLLDCLYLLGRGGLIRRRTGGRNQHELAQRGAEGA